jgi:hypothetical protein
MDLASKIYTVDSRSRLDSSSSSNNDSIATDYSLDTNSQLQSTADNLLKPAAQLVTCTEITVPITRVPRKPARSKALFLAPSIAAVTVLPTKPAVAPMSQHFQNGRGGSSRLRLVDRYV